MPARGSGSGIRIHMKGYPQYVRRGPLRGKLVHRVVMARLCAEFCYWPLAEDGLPPGFDIHHVDFNKRNWCHCNLLLMDKVLHSYADLDRRMERHARCFELADAPDWVTEETV